MITPITNHFFLILPRPKGKTLTAFNNIPTFWATMVMNHNIPGVFSLLPHINPTMISFFSFQILRQTKTVASPFFSFLGYGSSLPNHLNRAFHIQRSLFPVPPAADLKTHQQGNHDKTLATSRSLLYKHHFPDFLNPFNQFRNCSDNDVNLSEILNAKAQRRKEIKVFFASWRLCV